MIQRRRTPVEAQAGTARSASVRAGVVVVVGTGLARAIA
jgi:hypothetical protein